MNKANHVTWAIKHRDKKHGDIQLRIGRDSSEQYTLYIASVANGVQRGTFELGHTPNMLTNASSDEVQKLVDAHLTDITPFVGKNKELKFESNWFDLIELDSLGTFLVDYEPLDKNIIITTFEKETELFWSCKVRSEDLYELGLEQYEDDFNNLQRDMSPELLSKLMKKGLTEEDWIC